AEAYSRERHSRGGGLLGQLVRALPHDGAGISQGGGCPGYSGALFETGYGTEPVHVGTAEYPQYSLSDSVPERQGNRPSGGRHECGADRGLDGPDVALSGSLNLTRFYCPAAGCAAFSGVTFTITPITG